MNTLSILLYAGNVADNLITALIWIGVLFTFGLIIITIAFMAIASDERESIFPAFWRSVRWVWVPVVIFLTVCFIPNQKTVYMIAASEFGEKVVTSPAGQEVMDLVQQRIKDALKK